ncbi:hypothetical protein A3Q56_03977 [Intoshia linei]|uniref:cysteine--tRNA ligase n=1 Tax=Intoshia linei TaxID=1819745 RepID=A0A177B2B3_9BILA|nr:hypothetical protein A3Q56_03977 [Intoshia linei]
MYEDVGMMYERNRIIKSRWLRVIAKIFYGDMREEFNEIKKNEIMWYSCGPTVYDSAHMGHARSYITFDIIRRILTDYFNYNVTYIMNITDIDDKIITRARQENFFVEYLSKTKNIEQFLNSLSLSLEHYKSKKITDINLENARSKLYNSATLAFDQFDKMDKNTILDPSNVLHHELILKTKSVVVEWLDKELSHSITSDQNSIFFDLPRKYEQEFLQDMHSLNVKDADILTRVSEFISEIVDFIQHIIDNGYGYASNESVYFDTVKFSQNFKYGKLRPEALNRINDILESEGSLSQQNTNEKKAQVDFALWKRSNPGEPSWDSPWGKGRPGWHIECSVMAAAGGSKKLDIHAGGIDLAFPHHENEIAQSEACYLDGWVNYFLHSGHLTIEGCKMSKSLKNFISISDALKTHSFQEIRILFLLHSWMDTLDYGESTMMEATGYWKILQNFFDNVLDCKRKWIGNQKELNPNKAVKWGKEETKLNLEFTSSLDKIHANLLDNFDTKNAMFQLKFIICRFNCYEAYYEKIGKLSFYPLVQKMAQYVYKIINIFGLIRDDDDLSLVQNNNVKITEESTNLKDAIYAFCNFRKFVREHAIKVSEPTIKNTFLSECDLLRDSVLPKYGLKLSDKLNETCVRFIDPEHVKETVKLISISTEQKRNLEKERALKRQIDPSVMFINEKDSSGKPKYIQFNELGIPTFDSNNEPLSKSQLKKLGKIYEAQKKKFNSKIK